MGEHADEWSSQGKRNIWNTLPRVVEMQSEGGASGALHGALQTGALATTFTASQGLLLMIPNMYKIAGELTPVVIHVSARSLAAQALSIFCDHADVMATRGTGFAILASNNVQEAHDMAMIAHAATLESRVPFLHFFDGFRTSHEVSKIEILNDEQIKEMIDDDLVLAHRRRALSPDMPVVRGTAQNPDVYFQARETVNPFYEITPGIVENCMKKLGKLSGREYHLIQYSGDPEAERIIVVMGSAAETVKETVNYMLAKGEKVGLLSVRLYRPFPKEHFIEALPTTVKSIAVLDRTKEPGAAGEPLYQDVVTVLGEAAASGKLSTKIPKIVNGRYGLSSKEFTPAMVKCIFDELTKDFPKNHFTIGINDDVSHTSLEYDPSFITESHKVVRAVFFGLGSDGTVGANKNSIKIIGEQTDFYAQGYFVYDSKKSGSRTVSHLRFGSEPIHSTYLIQSANFIGCHQFNFLEKTDVLGHVAKGATFLLNSSYSPDDVWKHLPKPVRKEIIDKELIFYVIDAYKVAREAGMGNRINTVMQTCFFALANVIPKDVAINKIKEAIQKTYASKGEDVVQKNFAAVDQSLTHLYKVEVPKELGKDAFDLPPIVSGNAPEFVKNVTSVMMVDRGDELPVSALPVDGTFPVGTTKWEKRNVSLFVADWDSDTCIQCGKCGLVCPHAVIRSKRYDKKLLENAPSSFKSSVVKGKGMEDQRFTLQVYVEDCTGCGLCQQVCPVKDKEQPEKKAINLALKEPMLDAEKANIDFFETVPFNNREKLNLTSIRDVQYLQPLFEFSGACAGCGETPYVKLISQLFGDRMLIANATGCSSIYGGNLPTAPWCCNADGRGPTWSNSLFEDNAEFGLGFRLTQDQHLQQALDLLTELKDQIGAELVNEIMASVNDNNEELIHKQRNRILELKQSLMKINDDSAKHLLSLADFLIKRSVWIVGGDGWAYDIGFGGLDHVLASGYNVNVLVMDTGVYSNTGGQASKATPLGAVAKFAVSGKHLPKKDLGVMAMSYGYVYVASIALGANDAHTIKVIKEAEAYNGPSIILAYSHCIAHGINMQKGLDEQKLAVNSGSWILYRYNPDRKKEGLNPFELDSKKPSISLKDYAYNEVRFKSLLKSNPQEAAKLMEEAQKEADENWTRYEKMAE